MGIVYCGGTGALVIAACWGGLGGFIVSFLGLWKDASAYRETRRAYRNARKEPPGLSALIDLGADSLVLLTRVGLGALAGAVFRDQVVTVISVGAAAPALFKDLTKHSDENSVSEAMATTDHDEGTAVTPNLEVAVQAAESDKQLIPGSPPKAKAKYMPRHRKTRRALGLAP
jgi:hypothetical protein